jgi:transposase
MEQVEVILGVDTHLDVHVGAAISQTGKLLGTLSVSARASGYLDLSSGRNPSAPFVALVWKEPARMAQG